MIADFGLVRRAWLEVKDVDLQTAGTIDYSRFWAFGYFALAVEFFAQ